MEHIENVPPMVPLRVYLNLGPPFIASTAAVIFAAISGLRSLKKGKERRASQREREKEEEISNLYSAHHRPARFSLHTTTITAAAEVRGTTDDERRDCCVSLGRFQSCYQTKSAPTCTSKWSITITTYLLKNHAQPSDIIVLIARFCIFQRVGTWKCHSNMAGQIDPKYIRGRYDASYT